MIDIATGGNHHYAISSGNVIYRNQYWTQEWCIIPGSLDQIDAQGQYVTGVNYVDDIFQLQSSNLGWTHIAGKAVWASVGTDGTFWVVNDANDIFYWDGVNSFIIVHGGSGMIQVSVANAANIIAVTIEGYVFQRY